MSRVSISFTIRISYLLSTLLWLSLWTPSGLLSRAQPVLYPTPNANGKIFVYNESTQTLVRHPAGLSSIFFCESCPQDVTLLTSVDRIEVIVSLLNERGYAVDFEDDLDIYIDGILRMTGRSSRRLSAARVTILFETNSRVLVEARTGEWTRQLTVIRDSTRPRVRIELLNEQSGNHSYVYLVRVSFSERVVWDSEPLDCPEMTRITRRRQNVNTLTQQSNACFHNLLEKRIAEGIRIEGAEFRVLGQMDYSSVFFTIETASDNRTADIEITVNEGYKDFAGNPLRRGKHRIIYYRPFPPPKQRQRRLLRREVIFPTTTYFSGKVVGRVATVAVAGASAASFATTSVSGGTGGGSSITMINNVQKLHMTGMLAVSRMPTNYQNFTGEVKWAVLDIKTPWENNNSTNKRNATGISQRSLKVIEAAFETQDEETEFDYFQRMMFWVPALFLIVCFCHVIVIAYFVVAEKEIPDILQPPRLELMLAFFSLPPVSIACAGLYKTDRENAMLATWLLVAVPGLFITWNFYMLWFYVLRLPPHRREVNLITNIPNKKQRAFRRVRKMFTRDRKRVSAVNQRKGDSIFGSGHTSLRTSSRTDPASIQMTPIGARSDFPTNQETMHREAVMEEVGSGHAGDANKDETALTCGEIMDSLRNMTLLSLLLGEHQEEAEWVTTKTQGSKFHARYGLLFEEHRGPAIGRRDVTLDVDSAAGRVDRGELVILRERPLLIVPHLKIENNHIKLGAKKIYRYHLQLTAKLLDIMKTILVGCIVAGVGDTDDNISSIIALIGLSLVLILLLRVAKPFPSRLDMFMLLLAEVADLIVYTCALFLLIGPDTDEDTDEKIGMALLLSEAFALLALVLEYAILSIGLTMEGYDEWQSRKTQDKFFHLVHTLMMQNETYLQKKYFDRWLVRTFSRGLHGRVPDRHELHWKEAVKIYLLYGWSGWRWFVQECVNIRNDGIEKYRRSVHRGILRGPTMTMRPDRDASRSSH